TSLFNKDDPNNWQNSGAKTVKQTATEMVKKRLASYKAPELTKEQLAQVNPYIPVDYRDKI
ncbi:MAG: trimethylamine methyltransferase family protein, partial [Eubacterium sp.]